MSKNGYKYWFLLVNVEKSKLIIIILDFLTLEMFWAFDKSLNTEGRANST